MAKILNFGKGKLTYSLAGLAIVWGVIGWIFGWLENQEALGIIWTALAVFGIRRAID